MVSQTGHLFDPQPDHHLTIAIDETNVKADNYQVYVWAAVDVDTFEIIHIEASPGRSDLDLLLFIKQVMKRCRGQPVLLVDCGPWYNWHWMTSIYHVSLSRNVEGRLSVEAGFGLLKYRTRLFYSRFSTEVLGYW